MDGVKFTLYYNDLAKFDRLSSWGAIHIGAESADSGNRPGDFSFANWLWAIPGIGCPQNRVFDDSLLGIQVNCTKSSVFAVESTMELRFGCAITSTRRHTFTRITVVKILRLKSRQVGLRE